MSCIKCGALTERCSDYEDEMPVADGCICFKCAVEEIREKRERKELLDALVEALRFKGMSFDEAHAQFHWAKDDWFKEAWDQIIATRRTYVRGTSTFLGEPTINVGDKIWRPVSVDRYKAIKVESPVFTKTEHGSFLIFAEKEWGVWAARGKTYNSRGFKCFSAKPIPADWTHFVVTGFAKNGRSAFVEPVSGDIHEVEAIFAKAIPPDLVPGKPAPAPKAPAVPPPPPPPYICKSCNPKSKSKGAGRCAVCRKEFQ